MKMAAVLAVTLLLLCCSINLATASQGGCDYPVTTGADFVLPLKHKLSDTGTIQWKIKEDVVFNAKVTGGELNIIHSDKQARFENGSLKLTKVDKTKEGTYNLVVYNSTGIIVEDKKTSLCVYDPVTKPTVEAKCPENSKPKSQKDSASIEVTFTCKSDQASVQIEWLKNNVVIKSAQGKTLKQDARKVEKDSFSCKVSNRFSSMVSDPVVQECFESYNFWFFKIMGVEMWIIIASGGGLVVLLMVIVIVCCIMNRRKRRMNLKDEEELRLEWTNTEQQHHNHSHNPNHKHHHHNPPPNHHQHQHHQQQQQQQQPGHTGPRQNRTRQHREPRPRAPEPPGNHPQPSPRRAAQGPGPAANHDDETPPPLPQPRKKAPM